MATAEKTVAVWRSLWLPRSETFVRDHVTSLRRWKTVRLGLFEADDPLMGADCAPFPDSQFGRKAARLVSRAGYPLVYERALCAHRPSLVHAHFGTGAVEVLPIARRHDLPLLVTFHGHDVLTAPQEDESGRYRARLREVFDYASCLLVVSQHLRTKLLELGAPQDKIRLHYLGAALPEQLAPPEAERSGIIFVGRLTRLKGVDDLLHAYAALPPELRAENPVTIIGDGEQRETLRALAESIPEARVSFAGVRSSTEVAQAMAGSRVFVGPSKEVDGVSEAFGLTFLEAALAGTPSIGYDYGGVREAVVNEETGLLAPLGDVAALTERLERVLTETELAVRLGRAGQQRVVSDFDLHRQTAKLEDLYDELAC